MGTRVFSFAFVVALGGCASTQTAATVADLQKQVASREQRLAAAEHKIDELENRVFLLTDQVESQKVAAVHRESPRLPVVTLKPSEEGGPSLASDDDVAFEGAAAERRREPPTVLRIDGSAVGSSGGTRPAAHHPSEPAPAVMTNSDDAAKENLGIAPAPPIHGDKISDRADKSERSAPAVEPLTLYRAAYEELRAGRHDAAERGFRDFVKRFPHHDYADNAQYWLGETFYDRKLYDRAAPEFRAVVSRWPTGNKAPDALLKLGFCFLAAGEGQKAKTILREVPATYPHTDAARLAEERLAELHKTEAP
jgi:tol-pal system protein YbgF